MNLDHILQQTIAITKQAGDFMQGEARKFQLSSIEYKGKNDLVSYVDKETEKILVSGLHELLPEAGFITEEGTTNVGRAERYNWVIDPVDGTTNYVHGLPLYSSSIALMDGDEVVLGVINEPNHGECFHTVKGGPAYLNDMVIKVSPISELANSLLATGFPYSKFENLPVYVEIVQDLMQCTHGLRRMGSAAVDLAYVACGRFEGFFEYNLKPWDVAAGVFLVQQAGGTVTTFSGTDNYIFGGELVSGGAIHPEFLKLIQGYWYRGKEY